MDEGILHWGQKGGRRATSNFPSITPLSDGTLLASYRVGSTKDSEDETIEFRRSSNGGRIWSEPAIPFSSIVNGRRGSLKVAYLTPIAGEHLIAAALWVDREAHPGKPLFNPETQGCLPMSIVVADSSDLGQTWGSWRTVQCLTRSDRPASPIPSCDFERRLGSQH